MLTPPRPSSPPVVWLALGAPGDLVERAHGRLLAAPNHEQERLGVALWRGLSWLEVA